MQLFRDMSEPDSTDITQYPGYNKLSGDEQKKVAETYTNVYNNNQGKLGYRVAQGIAFETAKKMCESFVVEGSFDAAPGTIADEAGDGVVDNKISKPGPTYEGQKRDPISGMPTYDLEKTAMMKKIIGSPVPKPSKKKTVKEGDAEDFQDRNDALVGMTESEDAVIPADNPEEDGAAKMLRLNHDAMCMSCNAIHPLDVMCFNGREHSEKNSSKEVGAGAILKQNHSEKGMTGMGEETDQLISAAASYLTNRAKVTGLMESVLPSTGAGEIQKVNLAQKCPECGAMKVDGKCECTDCTDVGADAAKGMKQATIPQAYPQVKEAELKKCSHCTAKVTPPETMCPTCKASTGVSAKKRLQPFSEDEMMVEKHIGFKNLQKKLEGQGHSKESAGNICHSIMIKKYGHAVHEDEAFFTEEELTLENEASEKLLYQKYRREGHAHDAALRKAKRMRRSMIVDRS